MTEPVTAAHLRAIGWRDDETHSAAQAGAGGVIARVIAQHRNGYRVHDGVREFTAQPPAALRRKGIDPLTRPGVGDWVVLDAALPGSMIQSMLPRRTALVRGAAGESGEQQLIAANVDVILIVCGLDGDFNLRRIERYLVLAERSGAQPVIVLTKSDLADDTAERLDEVSALVGDRVPVRAVNARTLDAGRVLAPWLGAGSTAVLVGSSGAGKSTLTNSLLGIERQATRTVREHDSRGRHTTTHRALIPLPGGACLIDTPGMRELKLGDEALSVAVFEDVDALLGTCRFSDCGHSNEPGCTIRAALGDGRLDAARWTHFQKLRDEATAAQKLGASRRASGR